MSPSELESMFLANPDLPHRLTLASGDQLIVPNARVVSIEGLALRIVRYTAANRLLARSQIVSIPNIVLAELVEQRPRPRRRRPG